MKTLAQLEIELRYQREPELLDFLRQCGELHHSWKKLQTNLVGPGRHAHYCTRCLRVAIGDGVEF